MLRIQTFTFNPFQENTYVLFNENKKAIIIDPGNFAAPENKELATFIESNKLIPSFLLNTHCHLDHVFGNKWVADKYGLELFIHDNEIQVLEAAPVVGEKYGIPFQGYAGTIQSLKEGKLIHLDEDELQIIATPGHSPGSVSFYNAKENWVIAGDALFAGSIGRTDLPGGNFDVLTQSIRENLYNLPDETVVYSGHGPATTIGEEKKNNPFVKG